MIKWLKSFIATFIFLMLGFLLIFVMTKYTEVVAVCLALAILWRVVHFVMYGE